MGDSGSSHRRGITRRCPTNDTDADTTPVGADRHV